MSDDNDKLKGYVQKETEKAILFVELGNTQGKWIPKSQIPYMLKSGDYAVTGKIEIQMTDWMRKKYDEPEEKEGE